MLTLKNICAVLGVLCVLTRSSISESAVSNYHGFIREDAVPNTPVRILESKKFINDVNELEGGRVCGYTLYKFDSELPFTVANLNKETGEADLVLNYGYTLDYNRIQSYTFNISAHDCVTGKHADRYSVLVKIEQVQDGSELKSKEEAAWEQDSYTIEVDEDRIYDDILQLEVEGLNAEFIDTCKFEIISSDVPFTIDNKAKLGILRNTEKLNYQLQHNYILEVQAKNCGEEESDVNKPLIINIDVKEVCRQGWTGINNAFDYEPRSGIKLFTDDAKLTVCENSCSVKEITVKIKLTTGHIGKGCDRDTYSIHSQRLLCGADSSIVDLLPVPSEGKWTEKLDNDDGDEGDQLFFFDGKTTAMEVPQSVFEHDLKPAFTIMTWMKHEKPVDNIDEKEHVLCNADGDGKNRHHYSLFVHHCKLVLLVRREYSEGMDLNQFKPAEWRWHNPEICDGQWHHYSVSMDDLNAVLHIDGKQIVEEKNNPEIIDDWALHPASKVHFTKLMVGACWMGFPNERKTEEPVEPTGHMTQFFTGYLAGLSVLNGKTEKDQVLKCLVTCKEKLDFHAMQEMESGMSVAFNSEMSEITITGNGDNKQNIENLFHKIGYVNYRTYPTQGNRNIHISTELTCNDQQNVNIGESDVSVNVLPAAHPIITITGSQVISKTESEFGHGVSLFTDLNIVSKTRSERQELEYDTDKKAENMANSIFGDNSKNSDESEEEPVKKIELKDAPYKLDSCMLRVDPPMNFNDLEDGKPELLKYPANLIDQLRLEAFQNENGLIISGAEDVASYVKVMRQVKYIHARPEEINTRTFTLTCSELNGRFVSNEFQVTLEVLHVIHNEQEAAVDHIQEVKAYHPVKNYNPASNQLDKEAFIGSIGQEAAAGAGNAAGAGLGMIIIIVVCVGFLMFMIVLGVMRIRSAQHRSSDSQMEEKAEMEWDDSALTITVNPMDQDTVYEENEMAGVHGGGDSDSDDSDYHDDDEEHDDSSEDDEPEDVHQYKGRALEWDESDLSKYQCKV